MVYGRSLSRFSIRRGAGENSAPRSRDSSHGRVDGAVLRTRGVGAHVHDPQSK